MMKRKIERFKRQVEISEMAHNENKDKYEVEMKEKFLV